jgi:hypothetical protein
VFVGREAEGRGLLGRGGCEGGGGCAGKEACAVEAGWCGFLRRIVVSLWFELEVSGCVIVQRAAMLVVW